MVLKTLLKTFIGLVLCFAGIVLGYLFLDGLQNGANFLLIGGAVVLVSVGVFCLVKAGKSDATVITKIKSEPMVPKEGVPNMLERNNALMGDWKKTADARDRLKVLEVASNEGV